MCLTQAVKYRGEPRLSSQFSVHYLISREPAAETGSLETASSANQSRVFLPSAVRTGAVRAQLGWKPNRRRRVEADSRRPNAAACFTSDRKPFRRRSAWVNA